MHRGFWQPMDTLRDKNHARRALGVRQGALEDLVNADRADFWRASASSSPATPASRALACALAAQLGAEVTGFALAADRAEPSSHVAPMSPRLIDSASPTCAMPTLSPPWRVEPRPEVVFHLAAQSLVRASLSRAGRDLRDQRDGHGEPARGRSRGCASVRAVVIVTTDKFYQNNEWAYALSRERPARRRTIPIAPARLRRDRHRRAIATPFCRRRASRSRRRAPAMSSAAATGRTTGWCPTAVARARAERAARSAQPEAVRPWQHVLEPSPAICALAEGSWAAARRLRRGLELRPADADAGQVRWICRIWRDEPTAGALDAGRGGGQRPMRRSC